MAGRGCGDVQLTLLRQPVEPDEPSMVGGPDGVVPTGDTCTLHGFSCVVRDRDRELNPLAERDCAEVQGARLGIDLFAKWDAAFAAMR